MRRPRPFPRGRGTAAALAAITALGSAAPLSAGVATASADEAVVGVGIHSGASVGLLGQLSIPQLAALLNVTPAALIQKIEGTAGNTTLGSLLAALLGEPNATLQTLLEEVRAAGGDAGAVTALINALLAPATSSAAALQELVSTILGDLASDGRLGVLAEELGVPLSVLERVVALPISDEALATGLGTTLEGLSKLLLDAGAITAPLTPATPIVSIPVASPSGGGTIIGTPSEHGGVTLTTVYSPPNVNVYPAPASSVLGAKSESAASNAFKIVSVKLNRKGQIVETVKVPRPGRLTVKGTARGTAARNGRGRHRSIPVAGASTTMAAGTHSITLRPGRVFRKLHSGTFVLRTTYVPAGGTASSKTTRKTLRH